MAHDSIFIIDIETIKDNSVLGDDWPETKWPPPIGWKIVAVGMLIVSLKLAAKSPSMSVEHLGCITGEEPDILRKFWEFFGKREARVVTWNGRGFDMPVLIHRALLHSVPANRWFQSGDRYNGYQHRYSADWHCDLMDQMSNYGASANAGLDLTAKAIGLPGKPGVSGANVAEMYEAGRMKELVAYCETDVMNLYGVYLRWSLITGRLAANVHDAAVADLQKFLGRDDVVHRLKFRDDWLAR